VVETSSLPINWATRERARRHLRHFVEYTKHDYVSNWFTDELCDACEQWALDCVAGLSPRLMIFAPPRHGKSQIVSRHLPAWIFGRFPGLQFVGASYGPELALSMSRDVKTIMQSDAYAEAFPDVKIPEAGRAHLSGKKATDDYWDLLDSHGSYRARGVGQGLSGFGANCLPGSARIATERGVMRLDVLVGVSNRPRVLSFNHVSGGVVYQRILATKERESNELYTIETDSGCHLRATGDHRVFVFGRGYTEAKSLRVGDAVMHRDVQSLRRSGLLNFSRMPRLLREGANQASGESCLRSLRRWFRERLSRGQEGDSEESNDRVLQRGVSRGARENKVCGVRCTAANWGEAWSEVLRRCLQAGFHRRSEGRNRREEYSFLRAVRNWFRDTEQFVKVLLNEVFFGLPFGPDDWREQLEFQAWAGIPNRVQETSSTGPEARRLLLCGVRIDEATTRASYRRRQAPRRANQPRGSLWDLSCGSSQVTRDSVRMVERVRGESLKVYDIQVEGTENFFADGILVHNCLVIDDPVKDMAEARSKARQRFVYDWYKAVATTRIEPGGGILLMNTRWNVQDLAGSLLEAMRVGEGDDFHVITYPALATKNEKHRKQGEALVPHRFPRKRLLQTEKVVGAYVWSALYQQSPTVEGGSVFLDEWWKFYEVLPRIMYRRIYSDTAQKTKERNDFSVFQCWGMGLDNRIYLLDQVRGKWEAPELEVQAIAFWAKWNVKGKDHEQTQVFKIEDKSSGTGLIQGIQRKGGIPIEGIPRNIDKSIRADDGAPQIAAGNVVLPADATFLSDYLSEFSAFTKDMSHAHDDQIDPTLDAIADMLGSGGDIYSGAVMNANS